MSRLDSVIRRLKAQRSCLNAAAAAIGSRQGVVLELGFGNGRTFDHLRSGLPDHEIFVFDRQVAAHPDSMPDADHLILGDLKSTLPEAQPRFQSSVVLVHSDVGTGDAANDAVMAEFVGSALLAMLAPNALVVSDQPIAISGAVAIELPGDVPLGRYFMVQMRS